MPHVHSYSTVIIPSASSTSTTKHHPPFSLLPLPLPLPLHLSPNSLSSNFITTSTRCTTAPLRASPENLAPTSPAAGDYELPSRSTPLISASDVVRNFYAGINRHDLSSVEGLIARNCVYEDLVFPRPFVGRKAILEFFQEFIDYISTDLQFVIDAISEEDSTAVGVTWHLEWKGKPFPFSKGCSFYRLEVVNGIRQITYARDCVEPAFKPGESALTIIRGVTWLLQWFPSLADRL